MTLDGAPVLDAAVVADLRESVGGDDAFVAELVETYVVEAAALLEAMATAAAAGNTDAIVRPAHTLKSSSATIGAMRLASICRNVEEAGRAGRVEGLSEQVEQAGGTWRETLEALTVAGLAR
jgi:HPt (histidine-containing phosphotransfer) domain-containing protein